VTIRNSSDRLLRHELWSDANGVARLDPAAQQAFTADLERLWTEHNLGKESETDIPAEYLQLWVTP
jgi:hypothetical protein